MKFLYCWCYNVLWTIMMYCGNIGGKWQSITVGVSNSQLVNLYYCESDPDGVLRGHKDYTGLGRMSLRPVLGCSFDQHWVCSRGLQTGERGRSSQVSVVRLLDASTARSIGRSISLSEWCPAFPFIDQRERIGYQRPREGKREKKKEK